MKKTIVFYSFLTLLIGMFIGYGVLFFNNSESDKYGFDKSTFVDRVEITRLLQDEKYQVIQSLFLKLQSDFEQGTIEDIHLQYAYQAFTDSNPTHNDKLKAWLESMPDSWVAHMAYANYQISRAWNSRGVRYSSETENEQFSSMQQHFSIAGKSLLAALKLKPDFLPAYESFIEIAKSQGDVKKAKIIYLKALEYHPSSYSIRKRYMDSIEPKWGGSLEEIENVVNNAKQYHVANPHLKTLDGYLYYMKGEVLRSRDCEKQNTWYSLALKKAIHPAYYIGRSRWHSCNGKYDNALEDISKAISLRPDYSGLFYNRAKIYYKRKEYQLAIDDFTLSLSMQSYDPITLRRRASAYNSIGKYDLAIKDLEKAKYYGKYDRSIHRLLGYVYHNNNEFLSSTAAFKEAILLGDNRSATWYKLAISQWKSDDCDFLNSLKSFEKICSIKGGCNKASLQWVTDAFKSAAKQKQCVGYY